ncbi:MAG: hypothetical protein PHT46_00090 [Candidatus Marinimicrobia bacterium]|jgi:hypothetical protein|nr:hypothetical protein [Candidatus Neomarinimicrobiota bacterium]MDD5708944.1 hypothetical protein [Candidatus Neomarinimicrobiota bacterium]MDX9777645.1 hypothetical protein [bacterium]
MIRKIAISMLIGAVLLAGEGLPVLTLPRLAQEGYFPSPSMQEENSVHFSYASWYYDTDYSSINAYFDHYHIGFQGLISGNIEIRGDVPQTEPVGTTAYYNTVFFAGRNWVLNSSFSVKTTLKFVTERLYYASSWGGAADLEAVYAFQSPFRLLCGVENIGMMSPLLNQNTQLPTRYYLGADGRFNAFIVSLKAGTGNDGALFYRLGAAYVHPLFDVHYSFDRLQGVHHVGADLKWNKIRIGYGQYFHQRGLGYPMMFSIGLCF